MHACCQSPIAHRSSPCPLSRLSAVAHHHIIVTPSPKPNRTRPPRILSGSLSPRDMHACGGLVGAALYDRTGKSDQSVNSTTRAALLAPRNISRKIRVRQATRDETRRGKPTEPQLLQVLEPPATAALQFGHVVWAMAARVVDFGLNYRSEDAFPAGVVLVLGLCFGSDYCWLLLFAERERARGEQLQSKLEKESLSNANHLHPSSAPPVVPSSPSSSIESIPN
jgi:hypothetical protein